MTLKVIAKEDVNTGLCTTEYPQFSLFLIFATSMYHSLLLFSCKVFYCIFSSCGVLRLDLADSSIVKT